MDKRALKQKIKHLAQQLLDVSNDHSDSHLTDMGCKLHFIANDLKKLGDMAIKTHSDQIDVISKKQRVKDQPVDLEFDKLGVRFYEMISDAVKATGSYDPNESLFYFEEKLTVPESFEITAFMNWVHEDTENRAFGWGNYEERYAQFKMWRNVQIKLATTGHGGE